ncbi:MAG: deoxyribodipyrimidine photo-lyase [Thiomicrospira sp.]|uniref:cryptochrome/photolyase family protein n=1 Tax=Thiomicrospira sp. TaxID=935 RepID=UPI0019D8E474|nr:deoxyribodipyrimidine photo-lyase [Thiomicrospira sp.]MBE0493315.1 deoxyribodipyrimidine photo-lyase [Thiomicrospira sp.]
MTSLIWLQRDLRLSDHAPLMHAIKRNCKLVIAYFHDPKHIIGEANNAWLADSLLNLQKTIRQQGSELLMLEGDFSHNFSQVLSHYKTDEVLYHYEVGEPFLSQQHLALQVCHQHKISLQPFDQAWHPAEQVLTQKGQIYSVFTPFYKKLLTLLNQVDYPYDAPDNLQQTKPAQTPRPEWLNLPASLNKLRQTAWAQRMISHWQIGEHQAWLQVKNFCENSLNDYPIQRDYPAEPATSKLSVHLQFGELSVRELLHYLQGLKAQPEYDVHAIDSFIRQLAWREFGRYLLHFNPLLENQSFQSKFNNFPWDDDPDNLRDWQLGQTGVPIIDAGMRELWQTGWMHNRVRMLVASWLTKNANLSWREGQAWFANTLIDADPANNAMGWQWVAGCGVDAAPYYRLFNPVVQSTRFDTQTEYIKHWLPELKPIPAKWVHAPWQHQNELKSIGFDLPKQYRIPKIDLAQSRHNHLDRVQAQKSYTQALQLQN